MNEIRTDLSTCTTCLPVHLSHVNHHVGNNLPPRKTTIADTVNKTHHNGKTGTTGANGSPPSATNNPPAWSSRKPDHAQSTFHQHSTWDTTHFHSHHPAARLSAASHSRPLTAFSSSAQSHHWSKGRHPRSDTGDHSRGSSSLPAGHMQISLHDDKWVKFGLAHPERMKAASERPEEERPKPNASIDIERFQDAVTFLRSVDRRIPEDIAKQAISLISSARLLQEFDLSIRHVW